MGHNYVYMYICWDYKVRWKWIISHVFNKYHVTCDIDTRMFACDQLYHPAQSNNKILFHW